MVDALENLRNKLEVALQPHHLEIIDESARHQGHQGHRPGFVTHVRISITSEQFVGLSRLERHRRVHEILAEELASSLHALELKVL
ncbi:MAG: BolA family protein [Alphaproteobacteria bacterium]